MVVGFCRGGERVMVRVLVTRPSGQTAALEGALHDAGLEPVLVPSIAVTTDPRGGRLDAAARVLHTFDWAIVTSANGARAVLKAAERVSTALDTPRWAALGHGTAEVLEREGISVEFLPSHADSRTLAAEVPIRPGQDVVLLRGDLSDDDLPRMLRERGAEVIDVIAYRTTEAPASSRSMLRDALSSDPPAAVLFASGSAVRGVVALAQADGLEVTGIPAICSGSTSAREASRLGFAAISTAPAPDAASLAATAAAFLTHPTATR
jgi:uroporphyrinogen-III synthase